MRNIRRLPFTLVCVLGLLFTACADNKSEAGVYLPTIAPTRSKALPTAYAVAPTMDLRPTVEFVFPTQEQPNIGLTLASGLSLTTEAQTLGAAVEAAKQDLSRVIGLPVDQITLLSSNPTDWPDTCLGVPRTGVECQSFVTPGFQIFLAVNGQTYEYHTDINGTNIVLATRP
jgi:hypothetical protein